LTELLKQHQEKERIIIQKPLAKKAQSKGPYLSILIGSSLFLSLLHLIGFITVPTYSLDHTVHLLSLGVTLAGASVLLLATIITRQLLKS
jgi:hypothetical protein